MILGWFKGSRKKKVLLRAIQREGGEGKGLAIKEKRTFSYMAIKPKRGRGGKALMARQLREDFFLRLHFSGKSCWVILDWTLTYEWKKKYEWSLNWNVEAFWFWNVRCRFILITIWEYVFKNVKLFFCLNILPSH